MPTWLLTRLIPRAYFGLFKLIIKAWVALLHLWNFQAPNESPESVCCCFSIGMVSSAIAVSSGIICDWENSLFVVCYHYSKLFDIIFSLF